MTWNSVTNQMITDKVAVCPHCERVIECISTVLLNPMDSIYAYCCPHCRVALGVGK